MKVFWIISCLVLPLITNAQITSKDYRDASGAGPFPFYIGAGWVNTWNHKDFSSLRDAFNQEVNREPSNERRLYGAQIIAGVVYKPEGRKHWPFVLEFRARSMTRRIGAPNTNIRMTINQYSSSLGVRYAAFPVVFQAQFGPIISYEEVIRYRVGSNRERYVFRVDPGINGWTSLIRMGILDPAGTGGGLGVYVEWSYNFNIKVQGNELTRVIDDFNAGIEPIERQTRYGYFSAGILVPLALRFK